VNRQIFKSLIFSIVLVATVQVTAFAQRTRSATASKVSLMSSLPESDAVARVKVKRVLDEVMPKVLANNPAKLAEVNASIANFKTKTGLDPRQFEEVALGVRYTYPSEGVTKLVTAALARGTLVRVE